MRLGKLGNKGRENVKRKFLVSAAFLGASTASPALATDVFTLEGYGAISRGLGGAAVSLDVGPAGIMSNPATLSISTDNQDPDKASQLLIGLDMVATNIDAYNDSTGAKAPSRTHSRNRGPYFAPELAYIRRAGNFTFGIGAFAIGGLGTEYGTTSFLSNGLSGRPTGLDNSSRMLALDIPAAVSMKVGDRLTIGGSIDAVWIGLNLGLQLQADQVGSLIGSGRINGSLVPVLGGIPGLDAAHFGLTRNNYLINGVDGWGIGGRVGFTYKLTPATTIGGAYNFETNVADLKGPATLTAVSTVAGQIPLTGRIRVRDFQLPARLSIGITQRFGPQILLTAEYQRAFWKHAMKNINVGFEADAGGNVDVLLPQNYRNQDIVAVGGAYEMGPMTLRAGARFASQATPGETLLAVVPGIPKYHASAGLTYKLGKRQAIDIAYSHAFKEKVTNSGLPNTSQPLTVTHSQNNLSIGYRLTF